VIHLIDGSPICVCIYEYRNVSFLAGEHHDNFADDTVMCIQFSGYIDKEVIKCLQTDNFSDSSGECFLCPGAEPGMIMLTKSSGVTDHFSEVK